MFELEKEKRWTEEVMLRGWLLLTASVARFLSFSLTHYLLLVLD